MNPTKTERELRVKNFAEASLKAGFHEIGTHAFELKGPFTKNLTLTTLVHGNEIGGMEVFLKLLEEISAGKLTPKSNLRFMLGNVDAYFADKRYIESDLNRAFALNEHKTKEELRAKEMEKILDDTDVLVDIHQTIGPTTTPFFIFEYEVPSYNLARFLHESLPIIATPKGRFKGKTSTGYVIAKNKSAVTIETGQKMINETQISLGLSIARKAIEYDFEKSLPVVRMSNTFTFGQVIKNPDGSLELVKHYDNFDSVKKGELLARNSEKEVYCETDGKILFAKYGDYAKASAELALILKPFEEN